MECVYCLIRWYHVTQIITLLLTDGMCVLFDQMVSRYTDNYVVTIGWNVCTVFHLFRMNYAEEGKARSRIVWIRILRFFKFC
jgi:hypothetical protein